MVPMAKLTCPWPFACRTLWPCADYDSPYSYGSSQAKSYLSGSYNWNQKNGDYEVYITHK